MLLAPMHVHLLKRPLLHAAPSRGVRFGMPLLATSANAQPPRDESRLRMIFLGAPGSGKGTLLEKLVAVFPIASLSIGDLIRHEIMYGTGPVSAEANRAVSTGGLMSDDLVLRIVEPALASVSQESWLLDGYPRRLSQAKKLDDMLSQQNEELNLVVNLAVPDEAIISRIRDRRIHVPSGRVYNLAYKPPQVPGLDDVTGEPLVQREDDKPEVHARRLADFHRENNALLSHYEGKTTTLADGRVVPKLVTLHGETSDVLFQKIRALLEDRLPSLQYKARWFNMHPAQEEADHGGV